MSAKCASAIRMLPFSRRSDMRVTGQPAPFSPRVFKLNQGDAWGTFAPRDTCVARPLIFCRVYNTARRRTSQLGGRAFRRLPATVLALARTVERFPRSIPQIRRVAWPIVPVSVRGQLGDLHRCVGGEASGLLVANLATCKRGGRSGGPNYITVVIIGGM